MMSTEYDIHMQEVANVDIKIKEEPKKLKGESISRLKSFINTKYPEVKEFSGFGEMIKDTIEHGKGVFSFASHYTRTKGNLITILATFKQKDKKHSELNIKIYEGHLHNILEEDLNE